MRIRGEMGISKGDWRARGYMNFIDSSWKFRRRNYAKFVPWIRGPLPFPSALQGAALHKAKGM
jgi:hypothetical protein